MADSFEDLYYYLGWICIWIILFLIVVLTTILCICMQIKSIQRQNDNIQIIRKNEGKVHGKSMKEVCLTELTVISENKEILQPVTGTGEHIHSATDICLREDIVIAPLDGGYNSCESIYMNLEPSYNVYLQSKIEKSLTMNIFLQPISEINNRCLREDIVCLLGGDDNPCETIQMHLEPCYNVPVQTEVLENDSRCLCENIVIVQPDESDKPYETIQMNLEPSHNDPFQTEVDKSLRNIDLQPILENDNRCLRKKIVIIQQDDFVIPCNPIHINLESGYEYEIPFRTEVDKTFPNPNFFFQPIKESHNRRLQEDIVIDQLDESDNPCETIQMNLERCYNIPFQTEIDKSHTNLNTAFQPILDNDNWYLRENIVMPPEEGKPTHINLEPCYEYNIPFQTDLDQSLMNANIGFQPILENDNRSIVDVVTEQPEDCDSKTRFKDKKDDTPSCGNDLSEIKINGRVDNSEDITFMKLKADLELIFNRRLPEVIVTKKQNDSNYKTIFKNNESDCESVSSEMKINDSTEDMNFMKLKAELALILKKDNC